MEHLPPLTPLYVLDVALRKLNCPVTLLQSGLDNFALIAPFKSVVAVAHDNENVELRQLSDNDRDYDILFFWANNSAARELLVQLRQDRKDEKWPLLVAANRPTSLSASFALAGVSIQPTGGTITVRGNRERFDFEVSLLHQSAQTESSSSGFEPVKRPIGEAPENLRLRSQWFKHRSGQ